jgi:hypothetical protein
MAKKEPLYWWMFYLIQGTRRIYGLSGDSFNGITGSIRERSETISAQSYAAEASLVHPSGQIGSRATAAMALTAIPAT